VACTLLILQEKSVHLANIAIPIPLHEGI